MPSIAGSVVAAAAQAHGSNNATEEQPALDDALESLHKGTYHAQCAHAKDGGANTVQQHHKLRQSSGLSRSLLSSMSSASTRLPAGSTLMLSRLSYTLRQGRQN